VPDPSPQPAGPDRAAFPAMLRDWRRRRRMSQLELALSAGVSQRHLSYLESGRAGPSRSMILLLGEALQVPLRDRNDWLLAAGFAPVYRALPLDDPQMSQVNAAVEMLLASHEPFPAVAIDRAWNVRRANGPFDRLVDALDPGAWSRVGGDRRNLARLVFHPRGLRPIITNWATAAPMLWQRALREAAAAGSTEMSDLLDELAPHLDLAALRSGEAPLLPVLPLTLERDGMQVSLFTVISTFGTPLDVTADELRIESFFPADAATERLFRRPG
jgi:transcriptional regulator with XRE-family HTH domain